MGPNWVWLVKVNPKIWLIRFNKEVNQISKWVHICLASFSIVKVIRLMSKLILKHLQGKNVFVPLVSKYIKGQHILLMVGLNKRTMLECYKAGPASADLKWNYIYQKDWKRYEIKMNRVIWKEKKKEMDSNTRKETMLTIVSDSQR